jgi:hypothetical protein
MEEKHLTPLKAIRQHCLSCGNRPSEVRKCQSTECALHRYRMGHNPARMGIGPGIGTAKAISKGILPNPTQVSGKLSTNKGWAKAKVTPGSLGAPSKEFQIEPLEVETAGKIKIHKSGKEILIQLVPTN